MRTWIDRDTGYRLVEGRGPDPVWSTTSDYQLESDRGETIAEFDDVDLDALAAMIALSATPLADLEQFLVTTTSLTMKTIPSALASWLAGVVEEIAQTVEENA